MALAPYYRFVAVNNTGETIADGGISVLGRRFKYVNGNRELENSSNTVYEMDEAAGLANGQSDLGDWIDNTVENFEHGDFVASITVPGTPDGRVTIYYLSSPNGVSYATENWVPVASLYFSSSGTETVQFRI